MPLALNHIPFTVDPSGQLILIIFVIQITHGNEEPANFSTCIRNNHYAAFLQAVAECF